VRAPVIPEDDVERVRALQALALLDSAPEERFDRITRTAARLLGVPIALVNLVDDRRQWTKSAVGSEPGTEADRRVSFCAHVVGDAAPVVVPETTTDERFHDNPMVVEDPHLRAYGGVPVRGPSGHVLGSLCVADVAPRRFGARELAILADLAGWVEAEFDRTMLARLSWQEQQVRERVEAITTAVGEGIVVFDREGVVLTANPAAEALARPGGVVGRHVQDLLADADGAREAIEALLAHGELDRPIRWELDVPGDRRALEATVSSLPTERAHVAVVRDVSARRALERMKDEFVATVSHELRTPLTSIKGTLALVLGGITGEVADETQHLLTVAHGNTDRLIRLVNDVLEIERLSSGRVELVPEATDALTLVGAAVDAVLGMAADAGVGIETEVTPEPLDVDPDRVVQILTNLLGNAVRFSAAGSCVRLEVDGDDAEVRFRVIDEGRGIPSELHERIFDRFAQADASDRRDRAGTGLGLPIARGLAERHGGRLVVRSRPGEGATFEVGLPRRAPVAASGGAP
jgi:PAS domain S-box-containing protein